MISVIRKSWTSDPHGDFSHIEKTQSCAPQMWTTYIKCWIWFVKVTFSAQNPGGIIRQTLVLTVVWPLRHHHKYQGQCGQRWMGEPLL